MRRRETTPDISTTDHHRDLHPQIAHVFYSFSNLTHDRRRNVVAPTAFLHRFATQLEHDAFVGWRFGLHKSLCNDQTEDIESWKAQTRLSFRSSKAFGTRDSPTMVAAHKLISSSTSLREILCFLHTDNARCPRRNSLTVMRRS